MRAIVELWRVEAGGDRPVPENPPNKSELPVQAKALTSPRIRGESLTECAALAVEVRAKEIHLPCPSNLALDDKKLTVTKREFAFAWRRKPLCVKRRKSS